MRISRMLKTLLYSGVLAVGGSVVMGSAAAAVPAMKPASPSARKVAASPLALGRHLFASCSTSGGVVIYPDCEAWVTMSTNDVASVEFFANNDTPTAYIVGVSSDCDGTYFTSCSASPSSASLVANGGGADFVFSMHSKSVTGSQDVHVRFDATSGGGYVTATIHVTIQ